MANEKTPVVWDDTTKKHRPLGTGEKMGGLDASSLLSSDSGNLLEAGSDGLAYLSGSGVVDPRADNLLEESDRGKLQVTVDRIAEWLDGHPQDAAVLADAINVVSGDAGNVITAGSDKGAFLSKGAIAAAVAGMTDAQKAQLADAIAARIASDIADGKTIVASGGKLTSDPTNATAAQKKAINQALADADSGLVVNNSTGKLQVDFSQMPTDKFEALLKGLKMQIPLDQSLNLWVATNGVDAEGRGTQAQPFKTIQYCVDYATKNYALGKWSIVIHVKAGTYELSSNLVLPSFTHTSGYCWLVSEDGYGAAVIRNGDPVMNLVRVTEGGVWRLRGFKLDLTVDTPTDGIAHHVACLSSSDGATVYVESCQFSARYIGQEYPTNISCNCMNAARNSEWNFIPNNLGPITFHCEKGAESGACIIVDTGSSLLLNRTNEAEQSGAYKCLFSGDATYVVGVSSGSNMQFYGGAANGFTFAVAPGKTMTCTNTHRVTASSYLRLQGLTTVPGTGEPFVETSTYCWAS